MIRFILFASIALLISSIFVTTAQSQQQQQQSSQRWSSDVGTSDTPAISSTAIGFIGQYVIPTNNSIRLLLSADYRSGLVRAVRAGTGATEYAIQFSGLGRSVVVSNDMDFAVVTTNNGMTIQAFMPSNGDLIWNVSSSKAITCAPSISSNNILAVRADDEVHAGTITMTPNMFYWDVLNFTMSSPGVTDNELAPLFYKNNQMIFVIDSDKNIFGVNISTQQADWTHIHSTPVASPNAMYFADINRIMFLGTDGNLHAHNGDTGATSWKYPSLSSSLCSSAIFYDETKKTVFFGCEDSRIAAMTNLEADPPGAVRVFSLEIPAEVRNNQSVKILSGTAFANNDGKVYFGDDMGMYYTLSTNVAAGQSFTENIDTSSFSWWNTSSLPTSATTEPFTFVPFITSPSSSSLSSSDHFVILGNQRRIFAYDIMTLTTTTTAMAPPPPSGDSYIPVQFDVNIGKPDDFFNVITFISNLYSTLGLVPMSSYPYRVERSGPLGGSLYRVRIGFNVEESVITQMTTGMSESQRSSLNIVSSPIRWTPTTSAAPVLPIEIAGPLGIAIGVTCGIVAAFLICFFYGIWHSSKETVDVGTLSKRKSSTAHVDFQMENMALTNDSMFSSPPGPGHRPDAGSVTAEQQGNYTQYESPQNGHSNNAHRDASFGDDLLGGGPKSTGKFDENDL